jgi:hypothetical protein
MEKRLQRNEVFDDEMFEDSVDDEMCEDSVDYDYIYRDTRSAEVFYCFYFFF